MSTAVTTVAGPPEPFEVYRLTVVQYEKLAAAGVLTEDDNVELLDGYLVRKMTKGEPHTASCLDIFERLRMLLPGGWHIRTESAVRIPGFDEPEPDLAVVRGKNRDYVRLGRPPEPADVCLVIEVSDSSLSRDRAQKYRAYANGAIPVYWIVNLVDRKVEVYTQPSAGGYQSRHEFGPAQHVPVMIDGANVGQIAVDDIVP